MGIYSQIRIDDFKCSAVGVSKKEAKHKASVEMLKVLGLEPASKDNPSLTEVRAEYDSRIFFYLLKVRIFPNHVFLENEPNFAYSGQKCMFWGISLIFWAQSRFKGQFYRFTRIFHSN